VATLHETPGHVKNVVLNAAHIGVEEVCYHTTPWLVLIRYAPVLPQLAIYEVFPCSCITG
jgi:hypothetical protein